VLFGLTAITGVVDAVCYLGAGHVFVANMTGNVVLLGFAAGGAPRFSIWRTTIALLAFLAGAVCGGRWAAAMSPHRGHHWSGHAFLVDAMCFFAAALLSLGMQPPYNGDDSAKVAGVILPAALAMGFRSAIVHRLGIPGFATIVVVTTTITGLAADSSLAGGNPRWRRRAGAVLALCAGAVIGTLMIRHSVAMPLFVCGCASVVCAAAILLRRYQPGDTSGELSS
jgi:uncharacterized membrane protein YoaK (UPF0700 family)